jgi:DNA polymerase I-like protein with 3'-5' exonuclease and polymerase domains
VQDRIRQLMQDVVQLQVPLIVDLKQGRTWEEMG